MAGDGTEFSINVATPGASDAISAAAAVSALADKLSLAETAATAAATAVTAGSSAFKTAESTADRAAKAVETASGKVADQRGVLQSALDVGDTKGIDKAVAKLARLEASQASAQTKANAATVAMLAEGAALEELEAAASGATRAHEAIGKSLDKAKTAADAATKVQQAMAGTGKVNEMGEAFGKLGGPLGAAGQKAFGVAEGFKKMSASLGSAGPYVAAAVAIVAIATAAAVVTGAVLAGIGAITLWGIKLADTDGALKKQSDRMSASFKRIFGGLNIKPLLAGIEKVVALFDKGSASAGAMSAIFNSLFQPIVDAATGAIPMLIAKFIQFEIMVMKGMIRLKLIWQEWGGIITTVAQVVGVVVLAAFAALVVVIAVLAAGVAAMAVGFTFALAIIAGVAAGLGYLISKVVEAGAAIMTGIGGAIDWLSGLSLADIGTALIDGLIAGLMAAGPGVLTAITGIADGAIGAAKAALGIASPSKVFEELGVFTAEGMAVGVDGGAGDVQDAMESLVAPPEATTGGGAPASASVTAGGGTFAGAVFNFHGVGGDAKKFAEEFRDHLTDLLTQAGGGVPSA